MTSNDTQPSLTVWAYDTPMGAGAGEVRLKNLESQGALTVHDAITVSWMPADDSPRIGHLRHETAGAVAKGSAIGALVGMLVLAPAAGAGVGAGLGALAQRLSGTGIDEQFLDEVKRHIVPGTSALLILSGEADLAQIHTAIERGLERGDVRLIRAELADNASIALQELLRDTTRQQ